MKSWGFMIIGKHADEGLWWSNVNGWGDKLSATWFTMHERQTVNLPLNGEWQMTTRSDGYEPYAIG